MSQYVNEVLESLKKKSPWENLFIQAATEILNSLAPVMDKEPKYKKHAILERIVEPERIIAFRVPWVDDKGIIRVNNGWRVQFNSAIGPYKGGIRFHPNVNLDTLKFLGFEQILKNSLTSLPMGGGKGGANFDPPASPTKRSCASASPSWASSGATSAPTLTFPPATSAWAAAKWATCSGCTRRWPTSSPACSPARACNWGGSLIRPEATGYGVVYFAEEMLKTKGDSMKGKKVAISGFGNVSWGAALKATDLGAKVVTISGPDGYIYDEAGISGEKIDYMDEMLRTDRMRVAPYADKFKSAKFFAGKRPWEVGRGRGTALRHPERTEPGRSQGTHEERLQGRGRGLQHVQHPGSRRVLPGQLRQDPLRARQGLQRRRRGHLRPRDVPELHAPGLDPRRSGPAPAPDHDQHPHRLRRTPPPSTAPPATT